MSAEPRTRTVSGVVGGRMSVVMTYYNEEDNVVPSIRGALDELGPALEKLEVIAVDDHSADRTLELARALAVEDPRVRVIAMPENTRFAGALRAGLAAARHPAVFYTDGDCPIDYAEALDALRMAERYDVVIGYRRTRAEDPWYRQVYTTGYHWFLRGLFGVKFRDVNFSFKLFPRDGLRDIDIESSGSFIDAELLIKLTRAGFRVGEMPARYFPRTRGRSTLASPAVIARIVAEALRFRLKSPDGGQR